MLMAPSSCSDFDAGDAYAYDAGAYASPASQSGDPCDFDADYDLLMMQVWSQCAK